MPINIYAMPPYPRMQAQDNRVLPVESIEKTTYLFYMKSLQTLVSSPDLTAVNIYFPKQ